MKMEKKKILSITVEATIDAPADKVWKFWTMPEHIVQWNNASDDWHTPRAENDLRAGGKFLSRMEARDGTVGFDFEGIYEKVQINKLIEYGLADGRKVKVSFLPEGERTRVIETFDAEKINSPELQKAGWQAILNNFKRYAEKN
jgi:uncharacterized protein YndB with AHSA1/START domain